MCTDRSAEMTCDDGCGMRKKDGAEKKWFVASDGARARLRRRIDAGKITIQRNATNNRLRMLNCRLNILIIKSYRPIQVIILSEWKNKENWSKIISENGLKLWKI